MVDIKRASLEKKLLDVLGIEKEIISVSKEYTLYRTLIKKTSNQISSRAERLIRCKRKKTVCKVKKQSNVTAIRL